jgi:hypothetical protein
MVRSIVQYIQRYMKMKPPPAPATVHGGQKQLAGLAPGRTAPCLRGLIVLFAAFRNARDCPNCASAKLKHLAISATTTAHSSAVHLTDSPSSLQCPASNTIKIYI